MNYRRIVPEVIQTSAMDCGPAALKAVVEGFGIGVNYGRLRQACQTDVDGTSIDVLEEVAGLLGLEAEQRLLPSDHLLVEEAKCLPAIVLTCLPNGAMHFVVAWRRHGPWLQVMDPAAGRRWAWRSRFLEELYLHDHQVAAEDWRRWAGSRQALLTLSRQLAGLGLRETEVRRLVKGAAQDSSWLSLAALDATTRMVRSVVTSGRLTSRRDASKLIQTLYGRERARQPDQSTCIPRSFWSAWPVAPDRRHSENLWLRGAVFVAMRRNRAPGNPRRPEGEPASDSTLPRELAAALVEPRVRPWQALRTLARRDLGAGLTAFCFTVALAAGGVFLEALLLRAPLELFALLNGAGQRLVAMAAIVTVVLALTFLDLANLKGLWRLGRRLEIRCRIGVAQRLSYLGARYFTSRLTSDLAERCHNLHRVRASGRLGGQILRGTAEFAFTALGIVWLVPDQALVVLGAGFLLLILPLCFQPLLAEADLRVRCHNGALGRSLLDSLLGLTTIRSHCAERAIRQTHEERLTEWTRASLYLARARIWVQGIELLCAFGLAAWLIVNSLGPEERAASSLLLVYWTLRLPVLGHQIAALSTQIPRLRNTTLRLLEIVGDITDPAPGPAGRRDRSASAQPVAPAVNIVIEGVEVQAGRHPILHGLDLTIERGTHVAVLGPSGAGKSTFVGLLLGLHRPSRGRVLIDQAPLDGDSLEELRRSTAWVDPGIQLWHGSLLDNLLYGVDPHKPLSLAQAVETAGLLDLLGRLPQGMKTPLGEGGGLLSGGEGQRVRLGRSLLRQEARLVILDEACRGLDRQDRRDLLHRCRRLWRQATLIWTTHDAEEALEFDRVLVLDGGTIVEDGTPKSLVERPGSHDRAISTPGVARHHLPWSGWRRLRLEDGNLIEEATPECEWPRSETSSLNDLGAEVGGVPLAPDRS